MGPIQATLVGPGYLAQGLGLSWVSCGGRVSSEQSRQDGVRQAGRVAAPGAESGEAEEQINGCWDYGRGRGPTADLGGRRG